jgi:CheY-like chemotaxis protein
MPFTPSILVAEDCREDCVLLGEAFSESGVRVRIESVQIGIDAVNRIQGWGPRYAGLSPPDLVLLDLHLPIIDGREVLAFIKGSPRFRRIPTLVYCCALAEADARECRVLGADAILVKPCCFLAYADVVEAILGQLARRFDDTVPTDPRTAWLMAEP